MTTTPDVPERVQFDPSVLGEKLDAWSYRDVIDYVTSSAEASQLFVDRLSVASMETIDAVILNLAEQANTSQDNLQAFCLALKAKSLKTGKATTALVMEHKVKSGLGVAGVLAVVAALAQGVGLQDIAKVFSPSVAPTSAGLTVDDTASVPTDTETSAAIVATADALPAFTTAPVSTVVSEAVDPLASTEIEENTPQEVITATAEAAGTAEKVTAALDITLPSQIVPGLKPEITPVELEQALPGQFVGTTSDEVFATIPVIEETAAGLDFSKNISADQIPLTYSGRFTTVGPIAADFTPTTEVTPVNTYVISPAERAAINEDKAAQKALAPSAFIDRNTPSGSEDLNPIPMDSIAEKFDAITTDERLPVFNDLTSNEQNLVSTIDLVLKDGGPVVVAMFQAMGNRAGYETSIDGSAGPQTLAHSLAISLVCDTDFRTLCASISQYETVINNESNWPYLATYLQNTYGSFIRDLPDTITTQAQLESALLQVVKFATLTDNEQVPYLAFDAKMVAALDALKPNLSTVVSKTGDEVSTTLAEPTAAVGTVETPPSVAFEVPEQPLAPNSADVSITSSGGFNLAPDEEIALASIVSQIQMPEANPTTPIIDSSVPAPAVSKKVETTAVDNTVEAVPVQKISETVTEQVEVLDVISQLQTLPSHGDAYVLNADGSLDLERGALDVMVNGSSNFNSNVNIEPGSNIVIRFEQGGKTYFLGYEIMALDGGGVDIDKNTQEVIHQM